MDREELIELVYLVNKMILDTRLRNRINDDEVIRAGEIIKEEAQEIIKAKEAM